jgi:hypothetical protein
MDTIPQVENSTCETVSCTKLFKKCFSNWVTSPRSFLVHIKLSENVKKNPKSETFQAIQLRDPQLVSKVAYI